MTTPHYIALKVYTTFYLQRAEHNLEGITPDLEVNVTEIGVRNDTIRKLAVVHAVP